MKKLYWQVAKNTWDEMVTYRVNFLIWRLRTVLQVLTVYYLWLVLIPPGSDFLGYSQTQMLTYVLGTTLISSIVFSTRTHEIGDNINSGDLSIFLIRPVDYFLYWFVRDIADKGFNLMFAFAELVILFFLLKPPFFIQTNPLTILFFLVAVFLATLLYFYIGSLLGLIGFWSPEVWAPRFILFILLNFFAGSLFPLDILPKTIYDAFSFLPFPYLLYFPLKIYLGQLSLNAIFFGFSVSFIWIFFLYGFMRFVWQKGLRIYTAVGR